MCKQETERMIDVSGNEGGKEMKRNERKTLRRD
jgi:hypothetical protein